MLLWGPAQCWLLSVSKLLVLSVCLLWMHTIMHTKNTVLTQTVSIPFLCCTPVRSSPSSIPFIESCPRPVVQRGSRQVLGHVQEDNSQRTSSHKSCSRSIVSQGCVLHPGSWQKFCPTSCSALCPEHRKGYGEEGGVTVLHMKHRMNRITRDVGGIKDGEVLPKAKDHLTLPLKTSPRMLSKVNKLRKYPFLPRAF